MLYDQFFEKKVSLLRYVIRQTSHFLPLLIGLILLTACGSLLNSRSEPPLPTVVSVIESTNTPAPTPTTQAAEPTPVVIEPSPTFNLSPSPSPTLIPAGDTLAVEPTSTFTPLPPPSPTPTQPAPTSPPLESLNLSLTSVAAGLDRPTYLTHAGDGSDRLFVLEQPGRILIIQSGALNPTPFLDLTGLIEINGLEQGLLGLAFHPDYANNGFFFVDYTNDQGHTVIARYQVTDNPDVADPNSAKVLLTIEQPYPNHNGGQLAFGPDGYLYVGTGDGGSANDPQNNGQSLDTLLGKILRLEVDQGDPYGVPENNPFVNQAQVRPEIWSYGWRNPWRFSFDKATGDMYIADVGQNQYEEISVELAGAPGGQNYGWRFLEGSHCFDPPNCEPGSLGTVLPVTEYDHNQGCSVTGGYVYRGARFPALTGIYFYGDFCSGKIWGLRRENDGSWSQAELLQSGISISSFGQDEAGELYVLNHRGEIFQVAN
jgi:glucose/arabinose dehydrogenase